MKKFGIIGLAGRMGQNLLKEAKSHPKISCALGYDQKRAEEGMYGSLEDVFKTNDCVIDFSDRSLSGKILDVALVYPKPFIFCTTGLKDPRSLFAPLAEKTAVIIAPNTSFGAFLHKKLALMLAKNLPGYYDVDLHEIHHHFKKDAPSGTAVDLAEDVVSARGLTQWSICAPGLRAKDTLSVSFQRSGANPGTHEMVFTGMDDQFSISHTVFSRSLFAKGALSILVWFFKHRPLAGFYTAEDIFQDLVQQSLL